MSKEQIETYLNENIKSSKEKGGFTEKTMLLQLLKNACQNLNYSFDHFPENRVPGIASLFLVKDSWHSKIGYCIHLEAATESLMQDKEFKNFRSFNTLIEQEGSIMLFQNNKLLHPI